MYIVPNVEMQAVPGVLTHETEYTGMAKAIAASSLEWKKGDRMIVMSDEDEYYIATVTKVKKDKKGKWRVIVKYDDGSKDKLPIRSKYIFGRTEHKRRRVRGITKKQAQELLVIPQEKPVQKVQKPKQKSPEPPTEAPPEYEQKPPSLNPLLEMIANPTSDNSIYKRHPGSTAVGIIANEKENTAFAFHIHPNDLYHIRDWSGLPKKNLPDFYMLIAAQHGRKWANKLSGSSVSRPKRISHANLKELMGDSIVWANHKNIARSKNTLHPQLWRSSKSFQTKLG